MVSQYWPCNDSGTDPDFIAMPLRILYSGPLDLIKSSALCLPWDTEYMGGYKAKDLSQFA